LEPKDYAAVTSRWDDAALEPALSTLTSFTAWAQRQEILAPTRRGGWSVFDFALVIMLGLLGLRIFEACGANITDLVRNTATAS
jgi:hypothetical protein